ncbi:MAG: 3-oxoacyl-[acyl-carrier-protein] reductase [Candidatus Moranbacteria bacterium GW2011_GWE2_35_2-]|nr:MAG: 3-oxoacyl-[acyl-carrier-protein] reductase [Candidatus Moranbacteria bacterium GW2011_GWE2_35_2-]KKQ52555.1 MAG: 3-oxoacyl-[acyl-carrier-protein] reductase [Parcubacteria group bacterium GW2011_GWD2_38_11]
MFKDKIIIVTGSSSGIGKEIALAFAREGANVVITYKENKIGVEEVAAQINAFGGCVLIIQADLTSDKDAKNVVEKAKEKFGRIDILVNNAGRYIDGDEWDGGAEIWMKSLQQNLISVMSMSKYAIEIFQQQKAGVIVNIAGRYSLDGQYDALAYAAAKAGVVNITQAYAKLLAPFGRANSVSPGAVNTGYWLTAPKEELEKNLANISSGKLVEPKEIAEEVLFLASEKASDITGQNIFIDGSVL